MDTKFLLPLENLEKYKIPDFSEEELNTLSNYIQLTDALIEQQQLFDMFLFNFHNFL